jgi:hypothetical protein
MTRRAQTEAFLARYGSTVQCGENSFPAFIRPMGFQNTQGQDDEGRQRFSYVGPAAHKLTVGQKISSGGNDYTVKRCETVLLDGEELFVRAVLALVPPAAAEIKLERDGILLGHAKSCTAEAVCSAEPVIPWGEGAPQEVAPGAVQWKLTLEGVQAENGIDLFAVDTFRVVEDKKTGRTVYTGCRWTSARRTAGMDTEGTFRMEALAAGHEETEAVTDG